MKEHAYLLETDRLLVHSWMSLMLVKNLKSFISSVRVELLDILQYLQFRIECDIPNSMYMVCILTITIFFNTYQIIE